jgi:serine/threonine protein kinase
METFKSALKAFSKKKLDIQQLASKLDTVLQKTPARAMYLLSYLQELKREGQISLDDYLVLKSRIEPFYDKTVVTEEEPVPVIDLSKSSDTKDDSNISSGQMIQDDHQFRLEKKLYVDNTGSVWQATDIVKQQAEYPETFVSIKFLDDKFKEMSGVLKTLVYEFNRYQRLNHINIATAYQLAKTEQHFFLVTEYFKGLPLKTFIEKHVDGISMTDAKPIIKAMADALEYAHNHNIMHSDFNSDNVLYTHDNSQLKVTNFGISHVIKRQKGLELDFDPRDDVYSLACVSYELLTGKHPFNGKSLEEAEKQNLSFQPKNNLNRKQNKAFRHALTFDWNNRTATVRQFIDELFPSKKKKSSSSSMGMMVFGLMAVTIAAAAGSIFQPVQKIQEYMLVAKTSTSKAENTVTTNIISVEPISIPTLEPTPEPKPEPIPEPTPQARTSVVNLQNQQEIIDLLEQCQSYINSDHLTTSIRGEKYTALACYRQVLDKSPTNSTAIAGLKYIENRYIQWSEKLLTQQDFRKASRYIKRLEEVNPNSIVLLDLKERLKQGILIEESRKIEEVRSTEEAMKLAIQNNTDLDTPINVEIDASPKELSEKEKQKVTELLAECTRLYKKRYWTRGRNGYALACYRDVLKIDSANTDALDGMKRIENKYSTWIVNAIRAKNFKKAERLLKRMEKINTTTANNLKQRIAEERKKYLEEKALTETLVTE